MEKNLNNLAAIVQECGRYILQINNTLERLSIAAKSLNSLVTEIDIAAESFLTEKLSVLLPEATFLTEEGTVTSIKSDLYWIIDPIDGTTNFIHKVPFWGISVALCCESKIVMAVVADVPNGDIYAAELYGGAFKNNKMISVSQQNKLADSLIATGFPYYDFSKNEEYLNVLGKLMQNTRGIRRCGAASLDLCYTASGTFDAFFEFGLSPWDVAAGALIVQEAGGIVVDFSKGDNWLFGMEIIACNPYVAEEFIALIAKEFC